MVGEGDSGVVVQKMKVGVLMMEGTMLVVVPIGAAVSVDSKVGGAVS